MGYQFEDVKIVKLTAAAALIRFPDLDGPRWLPKSVIVDFDNDWQEGETVDIEVASSFAEKEELV